MNHATLRVGRIRLALIPNFDVPIEWQPKVDDMPLAKQDASQGDWVVASNGKEEVFTTRTNRRLLYCWQPLTGNHAYLDVDADIILTDEEAQSALAI